MSAFSLAGDGRVHVPPEEQAAFERTFQARRDRLEPSSPVDEPFQSLGVAGAVHRDGGRRGLDLLQKGCGEFRLGGRLI
jgi:hypothetical protein